ncbi:MAG: hypothetical protein K8V42_05410 [Enterococcus aquimarinus]|uniref:Uncharacterized protein n=1 Tax=Enterococcus aquimarinus TaxID=328396 RepID=A0A9E3ZU46_9ENTE|nr:hypothetical protein [Enterococcus aquimarinus]
MKIYHTETQADYDALMVELEAEGCKWFSGRKPTEATENWKANSSETCVRVDKKVAMYDKKSLYTRNYPDVPITEYKAADQEMKLRESGSVRYINTVYLPKCDYCNSNILVVEKYYFVAIEGNELTDVRIVHRECFNRSRVGFIEEETE